MLLICRCGCFGDLQVQSAELVSQTNNNSEDVAVIKARTQGNAPGVFNISWLMEGYRIPRTEIDIICSIGTIKVSEDTLEYKLNHENARISINMTLMIPRFFSWRI